MYTTKNGNLCLVSLCICNNKFKSFPGVPLVDPENLLHAKEIQFMLLPVEVEPQNCFPEFFVHLRLIEPLNYFETHY